MKETDIIDRFFEALRFLADTRAIKGVGTFTRRYDIDRRNLYKLYCERDRRSTMFKAAWCAYLVEDYGISPLWLLTGKGSMTND